MITQHLVTAIAWHRDEVIAIHVCRELRSPRANGGCLVRSKQITSKRRSHLRSMSSHALNGLWSMRTCRQLGSVSGYPYTPDSSRWKERVSSTRWAKEDSTSSHADRSDLSLSITRDTRPRENSIWTTPDDRLITLTYYVNNTYVLNNTNSSNFFNTSPSFKYLNLMWTESKAQNLTSCISCVTGINIIR